MKNSWEYSKTTIEVKKDRREHNKKNFIADMKQRNAKKHKHSNLGARAHTDKWVSEYMNDESEELKDESLSGISGSECLKTMK